MYVLVRDNTVVYVSQYPCSEFWAETFSLIWPDRNKHDVSVWDEREEVEKTKSSYKKWKKKREAKTEKYDYRKQLESLHRPNVILEPRRELLEVKGNE